MRVRLVFPHQLDIQPILGSIADEVWLVEDPLFFTQYAFLGQKLAFHRSTMAEFMLELDQQGRKCRRIEFGANLEDEFLRAGVRSIEAIDPNDDWLERRLRKSCALLGLRLEVLEDSAFLTSVSEQNLWLGQKKRYFFNDFYIYQRKRLGILLDHKGGPLGGTWSFDADNRKRLPKGMALPPIQTPPLRESMREAEQYVRRHFPHAPGTLANASLFPVTRLDAQAWLDHFLDTRLANFGDYEDAICADEPFLFHSLLTPMLNVGLLRPQEVVQAALARNDIPLNSLEGFIRQVIGWREYVRMVYRVAGRKQRTTNALGFQNPMPRALYTGQTGIGPVDTVIQRVLKSGYCHHIERLMVLGNFMALLEIHPDHVYQWFMELFIDAYDWVMVPNVYGMSQYADGGMMTTKPYVSGSNYVRKMSDFRPGPWCEIWDGLFWRFVSRRRELFAKNPRTRAMASQLDRMGSKLDRSLAIAEKYLAEIHST